MLIEGRHQSDRLFDEVFDYVIVGSGAAGATAARVLVDTGCSVAVLEEGPALRTEDLHDRLFDSMNRGWRAGGIALARGKAFIPLLQARGLGGTTVVNSAIMWRIPDDVLHQWDAVYGLADAFTYDDLHEAWAQIERELHVNPVSDAALGHNRLIEAGARKLGVSGHRIRRGDTGCRGSARCLTGCPHGAKQSMLVSYLPYARREGATIFTDARVDRIELDSQGVASGVRGRFLRNERRRFDPIPRRFRIRARNAVLVGCSTIQTPGLLHRSGIRNRHLGRHFQGHPGSPLIGVFDDEVGPWFGATQGFEVDEHRAWRFKVETLALAPEMFFARMPGYGRRWKRYLEEANRMVLWGVQLRAWAEGTVTPLPWGNATDTVYTPTPRDMRNLQRALKFTAELFFAAGAREVVLPIHGMPERIGKDELHVFDRAPMDPAAYSWILSHHFGTARMATTDRQGVVGTDFSVHGTDNVYVLDSSTFPTNLGVNPQQPIQGTAMMAARRIADRFA